MTVTIGAYSTNKGGNVTYTIPSSGTITKATGGFKNMTGFGKLFNSSGALVASVTKAITADSCPAAG
jgi:hypothetical protein